MNIDKQTEQRLLAELLCVLDTKWVLGHWYTKVILNGRNIPDFISMSGMAQDELGHTRAMFRYLEQHYELPEFQLEFGRSVDSIHSMTLLDEAPENWADFVITIYLADVALWTMMDAYKNTGLLAITNMFTKFTEEGYFHRLYIEGWLAALTDEEKSQAKSALSKRFAHAIRWFVDLEDSNSVLSSGLRSQSGTQLQKHFVDRVEQQLQQLDFTIHANLNVVDSDKWDYLRRREQNSSMPATLWEAIVPSSEAAKLARRPLAVSITDNIDLFGVKKERDGTEPFFDRA